MISYGLFRGMSNLLGYYYATKHNNYQPNNTLVYL